MTASGLFLFYLEYKMHRSHTRPVLLSEVLLHARTFVLFFVRYRARISHQIKANRSIILHRMLCRTKHRINYSPS